MRVLPGVVTSGRRLAVASAAALMAAAALALGGCTRLDAALGQRQAIVSFTDGTPVSQRLAVRTVCGRLPAVTPQALPSDLHSPYALQQLTFQITKASDAQVARLEECLAKFPAVAGVTLQDSSDEGD
jgi:hypothetical protein